MCPSCLRTTRNAGRFAAINPLSGEPRASEGNPVLASGRRWGSTKGKRDFDPPLGSYAIDAAATMWSAFWPPDYKKAKSNRPSQKADTSATSSSSQNACAGILNISPTSALAGGAISCRCAHGRTKATAPIATSTAYSCSSERISTIAASSPFTSSAIPNLRATASSLTKVSRRPDRARPIAAWVAHSAVTTTRRGAA